MAPCCCLLKCSSQQQIHPMHFIILSLSPTSLMAPNGESQAKILHSKKNRPSRLSVEGLQRTLSDISIESKGVTIELELEPISEVAVEDAKCECCGMSEECTVEYIKSTRDKFYGKLICGLCGEAVEEEIEKKRRGREEALKEHMEACVRFNRIDVKYPVLYQAEAFKEMIKKSSSRLKFISAGDRKDPSGQKQGGGLARSSSCIQELLLRQPSLSNSRICTAVHSLRQPPRAL